MLRNTMRRVMLYAGAGVLAFGVAMPSAMAQQGGASQAPAVPKTSQAPKTPAAGAPAVAKPTATAGDPTAVPDDAWVKLCMKGEQTQNKQICLINHERLEPNTGMVLIAAAVRQIEGEDKQQLLVRVPTAYALVIPAGVQIKIDDGEPISLQYAALLPDELPGADGAHQGNVRKDAQGQADGRRCHEHAAEGDRAFRCRSTASARPTTGPGRQRQV